MTLKVSFGEASLQWFILSTTHHRKGLLALGQHSASLSSRHFDVDFFFLSKTTKAYALPPTFEIFPVKSLRARNQTLAPPFPELRCLSLAYNKVTFCFPAYFLRGTDGRVGCLKASLPPPCIPGMGAQEFSGWGKWRECRPRQESISSVTDIYLTLTTCQVLC